MAGVRASVAAPRLQPARFGLLASFTPTTDERWQGGFTWEPESCGLVGTVNPCDAEADLKAIPADDNPGTQTFDPYMVWAGYRCSTFGGLGPDREARARRMLAASESRAVEAELWKGTAATAESWDNNFLANSDSVDNL